jgi:arsenate reductase
MAEAFFNSYISEMSLESVSNNNNDTLETLMAKAFSAGTQPANEINPMVKEIMEEVGVDLSEQHPKMLTVDMLKDAYRLITMGCGVENVCPASFVSVEDWQIEDPEDNPVEKVREIRDLIQTKVEALIEEIKKEGSKE